MAKKNLNLGAILSDLIKNANSNFTELYDAISTIQETIADDGEKAIVFSTVDKMITGLNAGTDENGNTLSITVGDEIYILDEDTPDFWVSAVSSTSSTGTKPSSWEKDTNYVFGKYTIRVSKAKEITLEDYQKISDLVKTIDENASDKLAPTAKAVYNLVSNAINNVHTHTNKTVLDGTTASYTTEEKTKLAGIDNSLIGVTANQIGKVKDVKVNGESVLNNGVANITINIDELQAEYVEVTPTSNAITVNGTSYNAIVIQDTDTAVEVLNASGQAVVTQIVRQNGKLYFCVADTNTYTLRKIGGNAVGGGGAQPTNISNIYHYNVRLTTKSNCAFDSVGTNGVVDYSMTGKIVLYTNHFTDLKTDYGDIYDFPSYLASLGGITDKDVMCSGMLSFVTDDSVLTRFTGTIHGMRLEPDIDGTYLYLHCYITEIVTAPIGGVLGNVDVLKPPISKTIRLNFSNEFMATNLDEIRIQCTDVIYV